MTASMSLWRIKIPVWCLSKCLSVINVENVADILNYHLSTIPLTEGMAYANICVGIYAVFMIPALFCAG